MEKQVGARITFRIRRRFSCGNSTSYKKFNNENVNCTTTQKNISTNKNKSFHRFMEDTIIVILHMIHAYYRFTRYPSYFRLYRPSGTFTNMKNVKTSKT